MEHFKEGRKEKKEKKKEIATWDLANRNVRLACNKANIYIKHNTAIYLDA